MSEWLLSLLLVKTTYLGHVGAIILTKEKYFFSVSRKSENYASWSGGGVAGSTQTWTPMWGTHRLSPDRRQDSGYGFRSRSFPPR